MHTSVRKRHFQIICFGRANIEFPMGVDFLLRSRSKVKSFSQFDFILFSICFHFVCTSLFFLNNSCHIFESKIFSQMRNVSQNFMIFPHHFASTRRHWLPFTRYDRNIDTAVFFFGRPRGRLNLLRGRQAENVGPGRGRLNFRAFSWPLGAV